MTDIAPDDGFDHRIGRSVSLDHAARLLGVSRRTIYNRIREGRLQTIRTLGGSQRVLLASVHEIRTDRLHTDGTDRRDGLSHSVGFLSPQR